MVSDIVHAAKVKVNEKGAEAAGVTGVMVEMEMAMMSNEHILDREFGFYIVDFRTRMILFSGVYRGPEDK